MGSTTRRATEDAQIELRRADSSDRLAQYTHGVISQDDLVIDDWIEPITDDRSNLVLEFSSAEGAHLVFQSSSSELKAVYAGPHGPENRPADIGEVALKELINNCARVSVKTMEETQLTTPELRGTL